MRRLSVKHVRPGMVLGWPIYDSHGRLVLETGSKLSASQLTTLIIYGIGEVLVEDERLSDIPVQPLFSAELEGEAVQGLRLFITESALAGVVYEDLLEEVERPVHALARELYPEVIGEIMPIGCLTAEDYSFVQPIKTAGLAMLLGERAGLPLDQVIHLGTAAALLDVGNRILLPDQGGQAPPVPEHPRRGIDLLRRCKRLPPEVSETILRHHEHWDGTGYPDGVRGLSIHPFARAAAIADVFYELTSVQPDKRALLPHEAVEFIMAYSGEYFDPALVQVFARQVPLYPTGVMIKLNTGEVGIVSDPNYGHIGRPVVRICYNQRGRELADPYDVDLAEPENQDTLIVRMMEY